MTDKEIIKALECHKDTDIATCNVCPYDGVSMCGYKLCNDALDLINRQQAEKEALIAGQETMSKYIEEQQAEIERLQTENNQFDDIGKMYSEIKSEAIKEFTERLKKAKQYSIERHENIVPVAVIDWLVKEMVGDNNAE
jgi:predicted nuclease with TOPRIM domain